MHDYWRGGACEHPAIISFIGKNKTQWRVRAQEARRLKERRAPSDQNQLNKHGWGSMLALPAQEVPGARQEIWRPHTLLCSLTSITSLPLPPLSLPHSPLRESSPPTHPTDNVKNARHGSQLHTNTNTNMARTLEDAAQGDWHRPTPHEGGLRVTPP